MGGGKKNHKLFIVFITFFSLNLVNYSAEKVYNPEWPKVEVKPKKITFDNLEKLLGVIQDNKVINKYLDHLKGTTELKVDIVEKDIKKEVNKLINIYRSKISKNEEYNLKKGVFNNLISLFANNYGSIDKGNINNVSQVVFLTIYLITLHNTWIDGKDYYSIPSRNMEFLSSFYDVVDSKGKMPENLKGINNNAFFGEYLESLAKLSNNSSISVIKSGIESKSKLSNVFSCYVENYLEEDILKILENYCKDTLEKVARPCIVNGFSYTLSDDVKEILNKILNEKFDYELRRAREKITKKISEKKLEITKLKDVYDKYVTTLEGVKTESAVIMNDVNCFKKSLVDLKGNLNNIENDIDNINKGTINTLENKIENFLSEKELPCVDIGKETGEIKEYYKKINDKLSIQLENGHYSSVNINKRILAINNNILAYDKAVKAYNAKLEVYKNIVQNSGCFINFSIDCQITNKMTTEQIVKSTKELDKDIENIKNVISGKNELYEKIEKCYKEIIAIYKNNLYPAEKKLEDIILPKKTDSNLEVILVKFGKELENSKKVLKEAESAEKLKQEEEEERLKQEELNKLKEEEEKKKKGEEDEKKKKEEEKLKQEELNKLKEEEEKRKKEEDEKKKKEEHSKEKPTIDKEYHDIPNPENNIGTKPMITENKIGPGPKNSDVFKPKNNIGTKPIHGIDKEIEPKTEPKTNVSRTVNNIPTNPKIQGISQPEIPENKIENRPETNNVFKQGMSGINKNIIHKTLEINKMRPGMFKVNENTPVIDNKSDTMMPNFSENTTSVTSGIYSKMNTIRPKFNKDTTNRT